MSKVFISYAHEDSDTAEMLYQDLRDVGADPWMDTHDIIAGERWRDAINKAIRDSSNFLVLLSSRSVSKRGVLQHEINEALDVLSTVPPGDIYLLPVRLDECTPKHNQLLELQWVDLFPSYESGFAKITRALEASGVIQAATSPVLSKEAQRLKRYRILFDRPAFQFPCVFEGELLDIEEASKNIAAAMATGSLYSRDKMVLAQLTPMGEFEEANYRDALEQIRNYLTGLQRTITRLLMVLAEAVGKGWNAEEYCLHMEFLLCELIRSGVSQDFMKNVFALMDQIDSERNTILREFNMLLEQVDAPTLPYITLSSEQLKVSQEIELNNGEGPQRWDLFYLRTHRLLRPFLEEGLHGVPLEYLHISTGVYRKLVDNFGVSTVGDLCSLSKKEVLKCKGIGKTRAKEIEDALLNQYGTTLANSQ